MDRFSAHIQARKPAGESDATFAARLGLERTHWNRIKRGRRPVTLEVAARAIALWPDLEPIYLASVAAELRALSQAHLRALCDGAPETAA